MSIIIECKETFLNELDIENIRQFIYKTSFNSKFKSGYNHKISEAKNFSKNVIDKVRSHLRLSNQHESTFKNIFHFTFIFKDYQ